MLLNARSLHGKAPMISPEKVAQIEQYLAADTPQRLIAKLVGVSRNTVGAISTGARYARRRSAEPTIEAPRSSLPERCPTCGSRVYPPCLACAVRRLPRIAEASAIEPDEERSESDGI